MIYTDLTRKALRISFEAHKNQIDKAGVPYVYHPYEVASHMNDEYSTCVALLHDVIEDSTITLEDLKTEGFPREILDALICMTHSKEVPYLEYVRQLKKNPIARSVKLADLANNSDLSRLPNISEKDLERIKKYKRAMEILKAE